MQKLRQSYKNYQADAYDSRPVYPTSGKVAKTIKQAEQHIASMENSGQYDNFQQAVFYKEKLELLYDISTKYEKKKMTKDVYHQQVRAILQKDYVGMSFVQSKMGTTLPPANGKKNELNVVQPTNSGLRSRTKSPLKQFFDQQQTKISKKVTFSNLLAAQQTPLKYGLKSTFRSKSPTANNDLTEQQIRRLKDQNRRLRDELDSERSVNLNPNDDRFKELQSQISDLSEQNKRLKSEVMSRSGRSETVIEQEYQPYNIKVRQNNVSKINSRNLYQSQKMSQYNGDQFSKSRKGSQIYYQNQQDLVRSQFTHNPAYHNGLTPPHSNNHLPYRNLSNSQLLNTSHSTIQTQFLNLDQSELMDEEKNHICREKIAFFKKSMVLYKGEEFDIAFKRSDLNYEMDRLRVIIYVNNKIMRRVQAKIQYEYEREDFELVVKKQISTIDPKAQGREEIQVQLRNATDLGSLITAKVLVGSMMKKIIVPAMFINFDTNFKYQFENIGYIERNLSQPLIIKPMSQFASIENSSNILQLSRQYEGSYPMAKLYGKSKVTKGIVKLTWKKDKLRIETCEEWKILMGYLFLNAEETQVY